MRYQAEPIFGYREAPHIVGAKFFADFGRRSGRFNQDDIGLRLVRTRDALGEGSGAGMIFRETIKIFSDRVQSRRREHSRLPHSAAETFSPSPGFFNEIGLADEDRPHWRSHTFAEAEAGRIKRFGQFAHEDAKGDRCIPYAGAI